jgi:DNA-binding GntR family transcriptional regulator
MSIPDPKPYQLIAELRRGIITGRYPPGSSLREEALQAEFGISRGPVREALRLLELRGLAEHTPRKGFRVRTFSKETIEDLYRMRAMLERHAVECATRGDVDQLVAQLEASNERMAAHYKAKRVEAYLSENVTFHDLIIQSGRNEPLRRTLAILNEMAEPLRFALLEQNISASRSVVEHQRITSLLKQRLFNAAGAATELHILASLSSVLAIEK